jgi:hypothetical protein
LVAPVASVVAVVAVVDMHTPGVRWPTPMMGLLARFRHADAQIW